MKDAKDHERRESGPWRRVRETPSRCSIYLRTTSDPPAPSRQFPTLGILLRCVPGPLGKGEVICKGFDRQMLGYDPCAQPSILDIDLLVLLLQDINRGMVSEYGIPSAEVVDIFHAFQTNQLNT